MAATHISFNHGTPHGALLHNALTGMENNLAQLVRVRDTMGLMIGSANDGTDYDAMADKFGCATGAAAQAMWNELNSALYKLTTNASVSDVNAALLQVFNKLR